MRETVDQAAIDEILASAEADTPENRLDKLEKEVDVLKGSVKKLLLDLRETLNNIENPFQNLQNLAEGALPMHQPPVQQVQVIPAQPPEPPREQEEAEKEENEVEEEAVDKNVEVISEEESDVVGEQVYSVKEKKTQPLEGKVMVKRTTGVKYDIVTLFNLMEWVKGMLEKYTVDSLRLMLEIFESAGYISEEEREFVTKVADLITFNDGYEDIVWELYRLYRLMNPEDTSMDSKVLSLKLDKRL